jgi:hypothetical protein
MGHGGGALIGRLGCGRGLFSQQFVIETGGPKHKNSF